MKVQRIEFPKRWWNVDKIIKYLNTTNYGKPISPVETVKKFYIVTFMKYDPEKTHSGISLNADKCNVWFQGAKRKKT